MNRNINFAKDTDTKPGSVCNDKTDSYFINFKEKRKPSRPPHLRGKEIGLYYAQMNRLRKQERKSEPLGQIYLPKKKREFIRNILDQMPPITSSKELYGNIKESAFKRNFIETITGKLELNESNHKILRSIETLDQQFLNELKSKLDLPKYRQILKQREKLPSFKVQDKIMELINSNQIVLISGETGCGKTTQVPQFILDYFIENKKGSLCKIVCTQPRRISAISVAERVAEERAEKLGISSGYHIRLEKNVPRDHASITFCTTGVILRQMHSDPCISQFSHIIIDEIHERDTSTDFLLAMLKQVIWKRKDLKIILMSATLNAESFSKYFYECPHLNIPGFTYPVEEYFLEDVLQRLNFQFNQSHTSKKKNFLKYKNHKKNSDFSKMMDKHIEQLKNQNLYSNHVYNQLKNPASEEFNLDLVFELVKDICRNERDQGAILIFLTGYVQISDLNKKIESSGYFPKDKYLVLPIHSQMPTIQQKEVFQAPPRGVRKIILSTNIAETSITIDDVVFVIDCGWIKIQDYNSETNTETLEPNWVAKANASQRKGRAGRCKPGVCFHLISKARYQELQPYQLPEILRTRLESVILEAKILQLGKIEDYFQKLMDSPDPEVVKNSLDLLKKMEALDDDENLTPLGFHLAKLPMAPQIGKMILFATIFSCLDPILNIAVCLDFKDPFLIPLGKEKLADKKRKELADGIKSDHLMFMKMIERFENLGYGERKRFCWEYFISFPILETLVKLKKNFMSNLFEMNFVPDENSKTECCNLNSNNLDLVRAVLVAGLYPNLVKVVNLGKRQKIFTLTEKSVSFHPKSVLSNEYYLDHSLAIFYKIMKSNQIYLHDVTGVSPFPVLFFGNNFEHKTSPTKYHTISIDEKLNFKCTSSTADVIKKLRKRMTMFLEYKISHPDITDLKSDSKESALIRAVIDLIISEESKQNSLDIYEDCG